MPKTTLLFLIKPKEGRILLGMKRRKFGMGKWNGVGGKLLEGESVRTAAMRETREEIGVRIDEKKLDELFGMLKLL